ncbi:hypothetical protein SAMN05216266_11699 [Amycolatopsis marina]|uniref:Uncharacterized protein n=1 Tax=Amycolatopsis marina TaxID=490629 RepID=A0A1I1BWJ7_9PSEU|nr:protein DpdD [Amycolatopsis marina]SFB52860.1 hypothetical protein SAMN05216266_11699 [Amycolatopsis marina]
MTHVESLQQCLGDLTRFGRLAERIEFLFDEQVRTWVSGSSDWLVIPVQRSPQGFYVLSEDREGQRRGREVLAAFLGPATTQIETARLMPEDNRIDRLLELAGLTHLSLVRRKDQTGPEEMLARLEDAMATIRGSEARARPVRPSHVDLLRDFRLALLQREGRLADQVFGAIQLTGRLSAENLRFLTVEMLGRLHRWQELQDLPYMSELLRARRPRAVNEILLEMVWHTEVAALVTAGRAPHEIYEDADLGARYGGLVGAVDVPSSEAGRAVGAIAARALGDEPRFERLVRAAASDVEVDRLNRFLARERPEPTVGADIQTLFERGQHVAVVDAFLDAPNPVAAELAVESVLDSDDPRFAAQVLAVVNALIADNRLRVGRRLRRDLADLTRLVDGSCDGWLEWCSRVGQTQRWADAERILRAQSAQWADLSLLSAEELTEAASGLINGWTGANQDQIVTGLDILCQAAAETAGIGRAEEFCEAVLLTLAEQHNLNAPVRDAYLLLLERILEAGPAATRYGETIRGAAVLWRRIAAPIAADWGTGLADMLLDAPCPDPGARISVISEVLTRCQEFHRRLSPRQISELAAIGEECGLAHPSVPPEPDSTESIWRALDGKVIGLYSLLPRAADSLRRRISLLCSPHSIEGNADTVATAALSSLATRADFMIVDTQHAAHAATNAIDAVRPRGRQIFPAGRGTSAFLRALEHAVAVSDP